jgi:hypothetical protein
MKSTVRNIAAATMIAGGLATVGITTANAQPGNIPISCTTTQQQYSSETTCSNPDGSYTTTWCYGGFVTSTINCNDPATRDRYGNRIYP